MDSQLFADTKIGTIDERTQKLQSNLTDVYNYEIWSTFVVIIQLKFVVNYTATGALLLTLQL